jgi:hypothetical protein
MPERARPMVAIAMRLQRHVCDFVQRRLEAAERALTREREQLFRRVRSIQIIHERRTRIQ